MTFFQLDKRIREALPDGVERRHILEGLHGIEEGFNLCATFYLNVSGHTMDEEGRLTKESSTQQQVNAPMGRG